MFLLSEDLESMEVIIVIDIGTSSIKTAAIDLKGELIKFFQTFYSTHQLESNYLEQDPKTWWIAAKSGIFRIINEINRSTLPYSIIGIACCGHSPTLVFIDRKGNILRPAITWQDNRAIKEAKYIKSKLNNNFNESIMTSTLTPGSRIAKLLWLQNNEPDTMKKLYKLLEPKDYINFKLTGEYNTSLLSGRGFMNVKTGMIYSKFLNLLEISESIIPKAVPSHSIIGKTTASLESEIGLPKGIPVIAGEMDSITSIIGTGVCKRNMHYDISGTSEIVGILIDRKTSLFQTKKLPYFAYPFYNDLQLLFGATQASGKSIDWFIKNFIEKNQQSGKNIFKINNDTFAKKDPLIFLPYMEGERSPLWNPHARGMFFGLTHQHTKHDLFIALLEGISFSILNNFETLQALSSQDKTTVEALRVSGGGAKNNHLNQVKADVLGKKVITTKVTESGLLGGAILATIGLGVYNFNDAINNMVHINKIFYPDMEKHDKYYRQLYGIYKDLYRVNQKLFYELSRI